MLPNQLWRRLRWSIGRVVPFLFLAALATPAVAQQPTSEQAREMLQTRPDLVAQLRRQFAESGLTPDQVRARLRAAGYPEDLLDPYLTGADTTRQVTPAPGTLDAVQALGLLSPEEVDSLRQTDSLRVVSDSVQQIRDSLAFLRADSLRADSLADSLALRRSQGLKRFGIEVFRRAGTQFEPAQAGPVDANYRLGPGDVLVLVLTGDVESAYNLPVTRDGFIVVPQVGQLYVANLTLGQLEDLLYTRLGRVYSGVRRRGGTTQFTVTVARLRNLQVFVVGDVVRPGAYQISGAGTVLSALYAAGGPTQNGSFRRVEVRRGGRLVDSLDVYDYLLRGVNASDARLQSGDVVFVPVHEALVKVVGDVARPAVYELKEDETLRFLLQAAGGFGQTAFRQRVRIHRILPPSEREGAGRSRVVVDIGPEQFADGTIPTFPMLPGDSVTVFSIAERLRGYVTVEGNVWLEGDVGFRPGMRLSDAIRSAGGPRPDVYLDRILVTRLRSDSTRVQLRSAFADSTGAVTEDIVLEEEDRIRVFSRSTFRPERYVTVTGAVRRPGRIVFREGMTIRDAILLADGVTESASLKEAEIARIQDARPGALAQTIPVPLDSTYLFERQGAVYLGPPGEPAPAAGAPDVVLQPYDNVLIKRQPGWELQRLVHLTGEVRYPGRYALQSKTERLADLIERAGGLTDEAYAGGVEFYRTTREIERYRVDTTGGRTRARSRTGELPLEPQRFRERVGVDLARVLDDREFRDNLILAGGDSVFIPEYQPTILVQGGVNSPGLVAYTPGKNLDWYVRAAGGYALLGDRARSYLTQPDGKREAVQRRALFADGVPEPRPGAEIYVPQKPAVEPQPNNLPAILGTAAQVLATLVTIIVVTRQN